MGEAGDDAGEASEGATAHAGDADSTGAMHGVEALPTGWLAELELRAVIERVAGDLHDATP